MTKRIFLLFLTLFTNIALCFSPMRPLQIASGISLSAASNYYFYELLKETYDIQTTLDRENASAAEKDTWPEKFWAKNSRYVKAIVSMTGTIGGSSLLMPERNFDALFTGFIMTLGIDSLFASVGIYKQLKTHNMGSAGLIAINASLGVAFLYGAIQQVLDKNEFYAFAAFWAHNLKSLNFRRKKDILTLMVIVLGYIAIQNT